MKVMLSFVSKIFFLTYLCVYFQVNCSNDSINSKVKLFYVKSAVIYSSINLYLYYLWYRNQDLTYFHFFNDINEWHQIDKIGHAFSSFWISDYFYKNFLKINKNTNKHLKYSSVISFFLVSSIELYDGFGKGWGFSWFDVLANSCGSLFYLINTKYLINCFKFKISYHFTSYYKYNKELLGSNRVERIIKDYNGQTYWLNFNLNKLINIVPNFISLSLGYSVDGFIKANVKDYSPSVALQFKPQRQYFLSLDLNTDQIKIRNKFIKALLNVFNIIKFPFPALELKERKIFFHYIYF
ncbi:MAG: YfiM family protein [Bacteroidales bacterium]|nr:YfiM family protein [Bacteroidales bacterium]